MLQGAEAGDRRQRGAQVLVVARGQDAATAGMELEQRRLLPWGEPRPGVHRWNSQTSSNAMSARRLNAPGSSSAPARSRAVTSQTLPPSAPRHPARCSSSMENRPTCAVVVRAGNRRLQERRADGSHRLGRLSRSQSLAHNPSADNPSASCACPIAMRRRRSSFRQSKVTFSDWTDTTDVTGTWKSPAFST